MYAVYVFIILYLLPLFVMGFSYTRVIQALYSSSITAKGLQQQSSSSSTDRQNNIYKPQPIKSSESAAAHPGDQNASGDNDPFPSPETTTQQGRGGAGTEGVPTTTSSSASTQVKPKKSKNSNDRRQVR